MAILNYATLRNWKLWLIGRLNQVHPISEIDDYLQSENQYLLPQILMDEPDDEAYPFFLKVSKIKAVKSIS
ncbi:hypothetical protein [Nitrosomonas sp. Nm34]|uniref:hypothetical protein n=1 Tax=Nitrosomonas sp. Nm34 TaxID=1881055 RepID=UPI000B848789|nr:hypothetical protein [Nitrosomonas sp. Nm34]